MAMNVDFYGRGPTLPLQISAKGGIHESADLEKIRQSIFIILGTQKGERVMRPDFGADLRKLTFAPNTSATAALARHHVIVALNQWETRISVEDVRVTNDIAGGRLLIEIGYRVRDDLQPQSMIYPFYLGLP
jgi:phage baseplate assembly protein W